MRQEFFDYRRTHRRIPCSWTGEVAPFGRPSHEMKCEDISLEGLAFSSPLSLRVNSHVKVKVHTVKAGRLILEGKICWCKKADIGWQIGLKFTKKLPLPLEKII